MQVAIFANGEIIDAERASAAARAAELVVAADGGARHCLALGISPSVVIGDLDSLAADELSRLEAAGAQIIRHPPDKDQTDLELALHLARERGAQRIVLLGAVGGRLDMTLANVLLIADPRFSSIAIELWHANQTARVLRPPGGAISGALGDTLSLIPLGNDVSGLVTHDLQFELQDEPLKFGPARGVSNRISGPRPTVELRSGTLLVVQTPSNERRTDAGGSTEGEDLTSGA